MSDRIVVMNEGRIEQLGTPFEIYNQPRTPFVASFVGTLNLLSARVLDGSSGRVSVDDQALNIGQSLTASTGASCTLALRPEAISLGPAPDGSNGLTGTIEEVSFLGSIVRIRVRFGANSVMLDTFNSPSVPPPGRGARVTVTFLPGGIQPIEDPRAV